MVAIVPRRKVRLRSIGPRRRSHEIDAALCGNRADPAILQVSLFRRVPARAIRVDCPMAPLWSGAVEVLAISRTISA